MLMRHLNSTFLGVRRDGRPYQCVYGETTEIPATEAMTILQAETDYTVCVLMERLKGERSITRLADITDETSRRLTEQLELRRQIARSLMRERREEKP